MSLSDAALRRVSGWAGSVHCRAEVLEPETVEQVGRALASARRSSRSVAFCGRGLSSGDAFLNDGNVIVDLSRLNAVIDWNPDTGLLTCEPGLLMTEALQLGLRDNWVVPAVPGTQWLSLGGAAANSVHGKNSFKEGSFGACVRSLKLMLASGEVVQCSPDAGRDLFGAVLGGAGLLGPIVELTLQLKKVPSPFVAVRHFTVGSIEEMVDRISRDKQDHEYVIGQVDALKGGRHLGRGTIHVADFAEPGSADPPKALGAAIRPRMFGVVPKPWVIGAARWFMNDLTMRAVTAAKYRLDALGRPGKVSIKSFFDFTFLLDQLPGWQTCYRDGFIEQQALVPDGRCSETFRELIGMAAAEGFPSLFTAVKAHRADEFPTSFSQDGMSITFDLPVKRRRTEALHRLVGGMNELVASRGGKMYLAKDQTMTHRQFFAMYPGAAEVLRIKQRHDPDELFQSQLYRRLYRDAEAAS